VEGYAHGLFGITADGDIIRFSQTGVMEAAFVPQWGGRVIPGFGTWLPSGNIECSIVE